jgi:membrane-bound metal-dependent hydrolase YbcI (DUF457 family)
MASFEMHLRYSVVTHALLLAVGSGLYYLSLLSGWRLILLVAVAPLTLIGATIPDVDHPESKPNQLLCQYGPPAAAIWVGILLYQNPRLLVILMTPVPLLGPRPYIVGVLSTAVVGLVYHGLSALIPILRPRHRGATHRIPVGVGMAAVIGALLTVIGAGAGLGPSSTSPIAVAGSGAFFCGFLSHLYLDGLLTEPQVYISLT